MKIKNIIIIIILGALLANNNYPIFLLHGFMGWGRDELPNHYYWGGQHDLQKILKNEDFEVYTLSVGPVSSNWERAIEAYTQIKGGCVDYGEHHAEKYNIIQKPIGKCYDGLYPNWDENNPIHIIGHSQGGVTARMLEYLLTNDFDDEKSELLNKKYENYIASITTISTPHNGTSLSVIVNNKFPTLQKISAYIGAMNHVFFKNYYNFDLEHWNLKKNNNETYYQFIKRINKSKIKSTKNSASWDLSIDGSKAFNKISTINQTTYYFSYSTSFSKPNNNSFKHIPLTKMNYYLKPASRMIGSNLALNSLWYENDGIVNTVSMDGPHTQPIKQYQAMPQMGIWQHMGILNYDHHHILLRKTNNSDTQKIINIYIDHCKLLYSL